MHMQTLTAALPVHMLAAALPVHMLAAAICNALPVHIGASLHSGPFAPSEHVCVPGPSSSYPNPHRIVQFDENSTSHGGKMIPFSGGSRGSHSIGSHTGDLPDHVLVGRHIRVVEPLSV